MAVAQAAAEGLSAKRKYLPSWLFYDAAGSRLFEEITRLPEYYLTSLEQSIFSDHGADIVAAAAGLEEQPLSIVELGAGSASKTLILLRALVARQGRTLYLPVDVSEAALESASNNIHAALPDIEVQPVCSNFTHEKSLDLPMDGRRLALYIGSSIGNFDPEDAVDLLGWLRTQLQPGDALLLGTDMVKDIPPLLAAYNDRAGVTAEFNKNMLARLNRELGANFVLDAFQHRAIWNAAKSRIEMHLDSKRSQIVHVEQLHRNFGFKRGESIHTENSYKFSPADVEDMLLKSGYVLEQSWYDEKRWFGVHLARIVDSEIMPSDEEEAAA
ncbi:MAG TPA: L-histidine N(alpha)-methyltransferase [Chthonomonadales bacterium]|nr:L-histidine N(alpha)-methyltransferase [Chthonomonadales bacterium]